MRRAVRYTAIVPVLPMEDSSPLPSFTMVDLDLHIRMLVEIHGAWGRDISFDLGLDAADLWSVLLERAQTCERSLGDGEPWRPDELDLAAVRAVATSILRRCSEPDFATITNHTFDDVRRLQAKATAPVRTRRWRRGSVGIQVGTNTLWFPAQPMRRATGRLGWLIAVPDEPSWSRVFRYSPGADAWREEVLQTLRTGLREHEEVEEFEAYDVLDLQQQARYRAHTHPAGVLASAPPSDAHPG